MSKGLSQIQAYRIALLFFSIAAGYGLVMRLAFSIDLPEWIDYTDVRHGHSHVALLGWLFAAFYLVIIQVWRLDWNNHKFLYALLQICVLGMTILFPMGGYTLWSILFTTAHLLLSYAVIYKVWKEIPSDKTTATKLLQSSLIFLFVASLGTWALAYTMNYMKGSALYYASIQWYLHFMFNGWMIFAMLAVVFKYLQSRLQSFDSRWNPYFFWSLIIATLATYALSVTWSTPYLSIFLINSIGVIVQLAALFFLVKIIAPLRAQLFRDMSPTSEILIKVAGAAFVLKIVFQGMVAIPFIATVSYTIKNFVIGFIHLLMLGSLSLFIIFAILHFQRFIVSRIAIWLTIAGIFATEVLLFLQGLLIWMQMGILPWYYDAITACSALLAIGVWWMTISLKRGTSSGTV